MLQPGINRLYTRDTCINSDVGARGTRSGGAGAAPHDSLYTGPRKHYTHTRTLPEEIFLKCIQIFLLNHEKVGRNMVEPPAPNLSSADFLKTMKD